MSRIASILAVSIVLIGAQNLSQTSADARTRHHHARHHHHRHYHHRAHKRPDIVRDVDVAKAKPDTWLDTKDGVRFPDVDISKLLEAQGMQFDRWAPLVPRVVKTEPVTVSVASRGIPEAEEHRKALYGGLAFAGVMACGFFGYGVWNRRLRI